MQKFNFSYDKENDDLFLYNSKSKSRGSVELGNLIFDYSSKKELVGLQMLNASKTIKNLVGKDMITIKKLMNNLKECKIDIKTENNLMIIKIYLLSDTAEISPVISIPRIIETSPALAYA